MTLVDNLTPALRSAWHPVAMSHELREKPLQVWLLGEPWVVVRLRGEAVAFQDRCPHRLAPLSAGCIDADQLRCGYHGWTFGPDGRCTAIPALAATDHLPPRARLRKPWGLVERYGLIWLAPAEPVAAIPHWPEWNADGCDRMWNEPRSTPVSAAQLVDNFLDAAHFPFVHRATFGTDEAAQVASEPVTREGWVVRTTFDTWYRKFDDPSVASGEHPEVQQQRLLKQGSASYTVLLRLMFPVTGTTFSILFCCQPETATSTRVYKLFTRDDLDGDVDRIDATVKTELRILDEDLDILERYQHMRIHLDQTECHTRADRLSVTWRQLLADLIALSDVTHSMR